MLSFLNRVRNTATNIGHRVNRAFNKIKGHSRMALPWIKQISSAIHDGAKNYSTLPVVGTVASQIGAVAGAVNAGAHVVEKGLNAAEQFQQSMGWG